MPITEYSRDQFDGTILGEMFDNFLRLLQTRSSYLSQDDWDSHFNRCVLRILNQLKERDPLKKKPEIIIWAGWRIEYLEDSYMVGPSGNPQFLEIESQHRHIIRVNPRD